MANPLSSEQTEFGDTGEVLFTLANDTDDDQNEHALNGADEQMKMWTNEYFEHFHETNIENLLLELEGEDKCGPDLRSSSTFAEIEEARRIDDPSLPRGEWAFELKRADWNKASQLTLEALKTQSKDMQLYAWLAESEIRRNGFDAVAPTLTLLDYALDKFWDLINPGIDQPELRCNIIHWLDKRISLSIKHVPLVSIEDEALNLTGVDLDRSLVYDRLVQSNQISTDQMVGVTWPEFCKLAQSLPDDHYQTMYLAIEGGMYALSKLKERVNFLFDEEFAPSLSNIQEQLEKTNEFCCMELERRGILDEVRNPVTTENSSDSPESASERFEAGSEQNNAPDQFSRNDAYLHLHQIAEYLAHIEPHSPVPYLIRRAVEWGSLSGAELYQELFQRNNGQLNMFELMGTPNRQEAQIDEPPSK